MDGYTLVHVDPHVVVVDKAAGVLTVPSHGEEGLIDRLDRAMGLTRHRLRVVHRLDRGTSGLLVLARSPKAAAVLAKELAAHRIEREYVALVAGRVEGEGTLDQPLDGRRAVTRYAALASGDGWSAVRVRLATGRRNQIRRHFAALGHPVLGEHVHAVPPELARHPRWTEPRLALHARVLGFRHPASGAPLRFEAPLPAAIQGFFAT
jgi:23S rRNA pseudouridine1911/1915/1917 synthase